MPPKNVNMSSRVYDLKNWRDHFDVFIVNRYSTKDQISSQLIRAEKLVMVGKLPAVLRGAPQAFVLSARSLPTMFA